MTKAELVAKIAHLPDDAKVLTPMSDETLVDVQARVYEMDAPAFVVIERHD